MNKQTTFLRNIFNGSQIRGKSGKGLLLPKNIKALGYALGSALAEEYEVSCAILIATDTRTSCPEIKEALIAGLTETGHDIFDAGICPTPFVAKALKDYEPEEDEEDFSSNNEEEENFFALGIIITASHNPAEYNGIKIVTPFGYLTKEMEEELSAIFHDFSNNPNLMKDYIAEEEGSIIDFDLISWYQSSISDAFDHIPLNPGKILLDCAHGATAGIASKIFQSYGIETIAINNSLDGKLINHDSGCGNPAQLIQMVHQHNTDWGCAFDGDGDRVIIVRKDGTVFDGDDIIATLIHHTRYRLNTIIVGTIMTNIGIEQYLQSKHKKLIRTNVGERNIIEKLIAHQAFLGSESCGHITMMDHAFCSDGIFAALMFFDTIASNPMLQNKEYIKYPQLHATIKLHGKNIDPKTIQTIVAQYPITDGRIIVRSSNTEPILRIMIEHKNEQEAQTFLKIIHDRFVKELS